MRIRATEVEAVAGGVSRGEVPWVAISGPAAELALLFYARTAGASLTIDDHLLAADYPFSLGDYFEAP